MDDPRAFQVITRDGIRICFDLYVQAERDAVLVLCPGFFQSKETALLRRMAADLSQEQDVLCMDFRGHGRSGGLYTFSAREGADLEAVLEWARERYSTISLLGFSLGGAVAINTATRFPDSIRSLIAVGAPSAFEQIEYQVWKPEVMLGGLRGWDPKMGCRLGNPWLKKERPVENIRHLDMPVLLIHGTRDSIVSHSHSERLHQAAREPKRLELIEGGGHAEELYREAPERFLQLVQEWIRAASSVSGAEGIHRHAGGIDG